MRYIRGHNRRLSGVEWAEDDRGYETPCWIWRRACDHYGYGRTGRYAPGRDAKRLAHRVIYEREHGPLPERMHLHHKCEQPACVNPAHLELLIPGEHRGLHNKLRAA